MKKLSFKFNNSYPTGIDKKVKKKFGIKTTTKEILCGLWEENECELVENEVSTTFCKKHSEKIAEVEYRWTSWGEEDRTSRTEFYYRTPRILIAKNEGGYNSTGICVDCLLENLKEK